MLLVGLSCDCGSMCKPCKLHPHATPGARVLLLLLHPCTPLPASSALLVVCRRVPLDGSAATAAWPPAAAALCNAAVNELPMQMLLWCARGAGTSA
jgi:hypothetical protein